MASDTVIEEFADFEVDDIVDEDDVTFEDDELPSDDGNKVTRTANFMGGEPEEVDAVEDLGIEVIQDPDAETVVVRVTDDIGPVMYGRDMIELKKGRKYRVAHHIYEYLNKRDLLWESQR